MKLLFFKVLYCHVAGATDDYATWKIHCGDRVTHVPNVGSGAKSGKKTGARSACIAIA
jgi:hypothetical protein